MSIQVTLERVLDQRGMTLTELSDRMGLTLANLSILKTGKTRAIRSSTLAACAANWTASLAICCATTIGSDRRETVEPATVAAVAAALLLIALIAVLACWLAGRPATRVSPVEALPHRAAGVDPVEALRKGIGERTFEKARARGKRSNPRRRDSGGRDDSTLAFMYRE